MKPLASHLRCPSCQGQLRPKTLGCEGCGLKVEGDFELNEFALLAPEDLHLLRIFVLAEGRIRDMEAPLGLSYPTIRSRLKALRTKVQQSQATAVAPEPVRDVDQVLSALERQELTFEEALALIRQQRKGKR